jgi:hypothetical protein
MPLSIFQNLVSREHEQKRERERERIAIENESEKIVKNFN